MSALEEIARLQPRALAMLQANGFVFDFDLSAPVETLDELGRWQKLAFSLYTDLCEAESLARQVLAATPPASAERDAVVEAAKAVADSDPAYQNEVDLTDLRSKVDALRAAERQP